MDPTSGEPEPSAVLRELRAIAESRTSRNWNTKRAGLLTLLEAGADSTPA